MKKTVERNFYYLQFCVFLSNNKFGYSFAYMYSRKCQFFFFNIWAFNTNVMPYAYLNKLFLP